MESQLANRSVLSGIAAVARAVATAILSLALGATLCLALILGGTALVAG
jgi:hypothetical protein